MTAVYVYGTIEKKDEEVFLRVSRSYKDQKGNMLHDLLPCVHWSKARKNVFASLKEGSRVLIKGRLETDTDMKIIVEEFSVL